SCDTNAGVDPAGGLLSRSPPARSCCCPSDPASPISPDRESGRRERPARAPSAEDSSTSRRRAPRIPAPIPGPRGGGSCRSAGVRRGREGPAPRGEKGGLLRVRPPSRRTRETAELLDLLFQGLRIVGTPLQRGPVSLQRLRALAELGLHVAEVLENR